MSYFRKFIGKLGFSIGLFRNKYHGSHIDVISVNLELSDVVLPYAYELTFDLIIFNLQFHLGLWWKK